MSHDPVQTGNALVDLEAKVYTAVEEFDNAEKECGDVLLRLESDIACNVVDMTSIHSLLSKLHSRLLTMRQEMIHLRESVSIEVATLGSIAANTMTASEIEHLLQMKPFVPLPE